MRVNSIGDKIYNITNFKGRVLRPVHGKQFITVNTKRTFGSFTRDYLKYNNTTACIHEVMNERRANM